MKAKTLALFSLCLLLIVPWAYGDGCIIPPTAFAKVQIPDQRALIHFDQGTETLVIDTSFKGEGTNFAWIVPVPSVPKLEIATTGLFPTLQMIFQPEIIHNVFGFYWLAIGIGAFVLSIFWRMRRGEPLLGLLLKWLLALFLLSMFSSMLLPASASLGVVALASGKVDVVERKRVGIYDTVVLSSRDGLALLDWLNNNGFIAPTNIVPAIQAYAKEGWCFVASRIRLDASMAEPEKPSPLALTFKTERPVYPLRLTGIGNDNCRIDLYVFGPGRAAAPNFGIERCTKLVDDRVVGHYGWYAGSDQLRIQHSALRAMVGRSPVATKLTARLSSEQMKEDAYLDWSPFEPKRLAFYSRHGAAVFATNCVIPFIVVVLLVLYRVGAREGAASERVRKACRITVWGAVLLWLPIYLLLPKTQVVVQMMPIKMNEVLHHDILRALQSRAREQAEKSKLNLTTNIEWLSQQLVESSDLRQQLVPNLQTNFFTGQPWRLEDSPGNCTLRKTGEGIEYVWYDIDGGGEATPLFSKNK